MEEIKYEGYPEGWVRLVAMVSPDGEVHALSGDQEPGDPMSDRPYIGLDRLNKAREIPQGCAVSSTGTIYHNVEEMYQRAEEYECAMKAMDDAGVPKDDASGRHYSLWGRAVRMHDDEHNRMRRIMDRLLNDAWDNFVKMIKRDET